MLRHRRLALFVSFVCFVGTSFLSAADASFVRLWPGWREADSFDRIGEFLGGPEKHLSRTVVRTQTTARAGYYYPKSFGPGRLCKARGVVGRPVGGEYHDLISYAVPV